MWDKNCNKNVSVFKTNESNERDKTIVSTATWQEEIQLEAGDALELPLHLSMPSFGRQLESLKDGM